MVRTTQTLCKYIPEWYHLQKSSNGYFKKQALFFMTRFYKNIGWSTRKNALNRYHYFLKGEMFNRKEVTKAKVDVNRARIAAACEEHGYKYHHFVSTLPKIDIQISLAALARLSIYEPQTFKALVEIAREATSDDLPPANFNPARL